MKLSDVVNRINGNVDRFTTDLEYYVGGEHFDSNELAVTRKGMLKENLNVLGFKFHFAFQKRDVLFMARNPHLRKAGMVMFDGLCSDATYILRSKDENVLLQEYLALQLQSDHFWNYCESHKVGSVNFANNWTSIANYEFDLPSIEEQKVLADKLWAAYRVKEAYRQLLSTTDEMLKAKFQAVINATNTKEEIGAICEVHGGATPARTNPLYWENGTIPWFTVDDIHNQGHFISDTNQKITKEALNKVYLYPAETILICCTASIGEYAYLEKPMTSNQQFNGMTVRDKTKMLPLFLLYVSSMLKDELMQISGKTTIHFVSRSTLEKIQIPVPSIDLQRDFVSIFTQAEATKASLRASIEAIDRVIRSLINQ